MTPEHRVNLGLIAVLAAFAGAWFGFWPALAVAGIGLMVEGMVE